LSASPKDILKQYWGYSQFRPLQEDIINTVLEGNDTLAILPTGGGKSICYQVPGMLKEGLTIVVSPLIALMKDQVQNLNKKGIKAIAIFSGMSYREIDIALDNCIYGNIKFLYVSPERLETEIFTERLKKMKVGLLAVDEAHCISQWGYDFRPSYLKIADCRVLLPNTPVIALTATATATVQKDITEKLTFKNTKHFQGSFERKNIGYVVRHVEDKFSKLKEILTKTKGTAIVYAATRRRTVEIAEYLKKNKFSSDYYHAGLEQQIRSQKQDDWVNNKTRIIVSTNAFGMGIDKPDVRTVVHVDIPESMEAYYQEAGRAGRDGQKSFAVLLYNISDKLNIEQKLKQHYPNYEEILQIYDSLGNYFKLAVGAGVGETFEFDISAFATNFKFSIQKIIIAVKLLEQQELISASEAVYIPSRIKIIVDRQNLYNYQLRYPTYDPIIKLLLRTVPGVMDDYMTLKEYDAAKILNTHTNEIKKQLNYLKQVGILDYVASIDLPTVTFTQPRNFSKYLQLNRKFIESRKEIFEKQLRSMLNYAANKQLCRSKMILEYFGEEAERCGSCDICLKLNKMNISELKFENLFNAIKENLLQKPMPLEALTLYISDYSKDNILAMLKWLTDNGQIACNEEKKFIWLH
jgi:ATP-dependent DNA helicase RecQ